MNVLSLSPSACSFQLLKSVGKAPGWREVAGGEVAVVVEVVLVVVLEGGSGEVGGEVEPPLGVWWSWRRRLMFVCWCWFLFCSLCDLWDQDQ